MNGQLNHMMDNNNCMDMDVMDSEDRYGEDWHPSDSMPNISRMGNTSIDDNQSMTSSKSSIKSNSSKGRDSVRNHKTNRKINGSQQRVVLMIKDQYCWDCHKRGVDYSCNTCLRSYHKKCPSLKKSLSELSTEHQSCPECIGIMEAEEGTNPSGCMKRLNGNVDRMAELLEYTIVTVKAADLKKSFLKPVSTEEYPQYLQYIVNPMDLSLVEENVKNKTYASTNSFLADIKWIYHNCFVFNSDDNTGLISEARNIIRVAKQECEEIEICPDCYLNYYTLEEENYFAAVCSRPHAIVWAKLKGHPFWPAKVVRYNRNKHEVDVRFFGTHDKCWLKPENCYLMSRDYPQNKRPATKFDQGKFDAAVTDMNNHLDQLDKNLFTFREKHTVFTVDDLYLQNNPTLISTKEESEPMPQKAKKSNKKHKKVLNSYNGIPFKSLKVIASPVTFDISTHFERKSSPEVSPLPQKRFKHSSLKNSPPFKSSPKRPKQSSTNLKKKCFSTAFAIREEMSSSLESDQSLCGSKEFNKMDNYMGSNVWEQKSNSKNNFNENRLHSTPILSRTQTVTVSGKTSQVFNLNHLSKRLNHEMSDDSNKLLLDINDNISTFSDSNSSPKQRIQSPQNSEFKLKITDISELSKRIKTLESRNKRLEEELSKANIEMNNLKEENDELKNSIIDNKKKQWCNNCSQEAILPCCWNTCYCTVDCQHQHWPTHSKTCRRKQQLTKT